MKSVRNTRSQSQLVEFKGTGMQVVSAHLRTGNAEQLAEALETMLGSSPDFFCGEAALLDCTSTDSETVIEWSALCQLLRRYQLNPVAARVSSPAQKEAARAAGLVVVEGEERAPRSTPKPQPESKSVPPQSAPAPAPQLTSGTLLVDRPLRSGQQIYARGGDLIILAMVNTGAEVMADGNIHIYAPLRGRALAGANGNTDARIFTTCMEAELVSIAGVYRVLENGLPPEVARRSAQVKLQINEQTQQSNLTIETLSIG